MKYNAETRELTLTTHDCYCMDGKVYGKSRCPKCNGTGNGPRGGRGTCKHCYDGWYVDTTKLVNCGRCEGTHVVEDDWCSNIPVEAREALANDIVVLRGTFGDYETRGWALWHSLDYGHASGMTDDEIREMVATKIREDSIQATKVVDERLGTDTVKPMCEGILVHVEKYGYGVYGRFRREAA